MICQDVDERVPRKSKAREEAADSGEKVKLLSELSDRSARYILIQGMEVIFLVVEAAQCSVVT